MLTQLLNKAAHTLHGGFMTTSLGDRGTVVLVLLVTSAFPDSLGFCFWLGAGLLMGWPALPLAGREVSPEQLNLFAVVLLLTGVAGLWRNLRKMAGQPAVR
jgi:hypothetical protein